MLKLYIIIYMTQKAFIQDKGFLIFNVLCQVKNLNGEFFCTIVLSALYKQKNICYI